MVTMRVYKHVQTGTTRIDLKNYDCGRGESEGHVESGRYIVVLAGCVQYKGPTNGETNVMFVRLSKYNTIYSLRCPRYDYVLYPVVP